MVDLNDYFYFVHVAEKGGFAPAARALGVPKSRLSRHITQLESQLNARLVERSSRHFSITELGEAFYQHARSMLNEVEAAEALIKRKTNVLSGRVRLSCSIGVAQFALSKILGPFLLDNPKINVIQQVTNETVNLREQGIDLAVRAHIKDLPDSGLIQSQLGKAPWFLMASKQYLDNTETPKTIDDLDQHMGLKLGWKPETGTWSLWNADNVEATVPFNTRFCSDDITTLKQAALDGLGIVALPAYTCRDELARGDMQRVLPDWHAGIARFTLLMTSRKGVQPAVKALADYLKHAMADVLML